MSRSEWFACVGGSLGLLAAQYAPAWLALSSGWSILATQEPTSARFVSGLLILPLPVAGAILACGVLNFAEVHGLAGPQRQRRRPLPPYPFDPHKTQLVIGETHQQDGARSEQPSWLVLPEKGPVHGDPDHRRHRLRQDVGRAVPVHGTAHPPARPRSGPEDGRAHHRRQGQLR